jgi:carbonic anhydrase/acetyltransferase-like protein (isoleucine patch superfamily)
VPVYALGDRVPSIHPTAFVHPDAVVIGSVTIGAESSVWPAAVLRGDTSHISIGERTSIQDGTVIHCTRVLPTVIGNDCVVGHNAHLEGCTVEDDCLIGSGSIVLHRVVVRRGALVGAAALVTNDTEVPPRAMALGVPATIREDAVAEGQFRRSAEGYVRNAHLYAAELRRLDG